MIGDRNDEPWWDEEEFKLLDLESKLVDLAMHLHAETAKAYKLSENGNEAFAQWVPKSLVEHDEDDDIFTMPQWMAEQRGWI